MDLAHLLLLSISLVPLKRNLAGYLNKWPTTMVTIHIPSGSLWLLMPLSSLGGDASPAPRTTDAALCQQHVCVETLLELAVHVRQQVDFLFLFLNFHLFNRLFLSVQLAEIDDEA